MFFFNDTATTEIYTLSLHDALPIYRPLRGDPPAQGAQHAHVGGRGEQALKRVSWRNQALGDHPPRRLGRSEGRRSEEHTSELQSRQYLVCRLLLEKKKKRR